jgi:hypothetical protein
MLFINLNGIKNAKIIKFIINFLIIPGKVLLASAYKEK